MHACKLSCPSPHPKGGEFPEKIFARLLARSAGYEIWRLGGRIPRVPLYQVTKLVEFVLPRVSVITLGRPRNLLVVVLGPGEDDVIT